MKKLLPICGNGQVAGRGVRMEIQLASALAIAALLTTGCARPPKQVVGSPAGLKEAIEKVAPAKMYAIYASGRPARVEDLLDTVLFACDCASNDIDEAIVAAFLESLHVQIFRSSEVSTIAGNVNCQDSDACMTGNENLDLSTAQQEIAGRLHRISKFYGRSTTRAALMGKSDRKSTRLNSSH